MFSVAKDFEGRLESLFLMVKDTFNDKKLDQKKSRQISIELKLISNLFSIISSNLQSSIDEKIYSETQSNFNELRELIGDIELFYKDDPGKLEKDLINKYSKFIGSFIKMKFNLLTKK